MLRRLDQETEVPPQQLQRDPVLVVDRLLVDVRQPVEQTMRKRGILLGGFGRPVREIGHRLAAAELDVRALLGGKRRVLVADGGDERRWARAGGLPIRGPRTASRQQQGDQHGSDRRLGQAPHVALQFLDRGIHRDSVGVD